MYIEYLINKKKYIMIVDLKVIMILIKLLNL